jgi:DNA repair exonuclease SbcCD ATPase subunit
MAVAVPQVTVVEKVIDSQNLSTQEMEAWLQGERSRLSSSMQDIITQQSKALSEVINEEVHRVVAMVNAVSNSCEERLVRLEADRSARATAFQGLKRDFDGVQAQIADLEQFRMIGSSAKDQAGKEREEVMAILDAVTKDIRNQHRSVLTGLTAQKEMQQKLEAALMEVRGNIDTLSAEVRQHRGQFAGLSSQQDLLILQQDQQKIDQALVDLRRQTQQSLDVLRSESANEVMSLRQTQLGGLLERVQSLEAGRNEIQDLQRVLQIERSARNELAQTFDAHRSAHLQSFSDLRLEMESCSEKYLRIEERSAREKSGEKFVGLESSLNELRSVVNRRCGDLEVKVEACTYITKDVQDLKRDLTMEKSERVEQFQALEAHRRAHLQEFERVNERLNQVTSAPVEDRAGRERCLQLERGHQEIRTVITRELQKYTSRFESLEGNFKDLEETTRSLRTEGAARTDLSQTIDAYRVAHLRTSAELRADLDLAMEKLGRLESATMQDRAQLALGGGRLAINGSAGENGRQNFSSPLRQGIGAIASREVAKDVEVECKVKVEVEEKIVKDEIRFQSPGCNSSPSGLAADEDATAFGAGGSLLGRRIPSDVAEVLADERRLVGRSLRAAGKR